MSEYLSSFHVAVDPADEVLQARALGLQTELDYKVQDPAFDRLAGMFGAELPEGEGRLGALQNVAAQYWDFRKGVERQAVDWDSELSDPASEQGRAIFRNAGGLGLVASSHPVLPEYDFGIVTGGANKSPWDRTRYIQEQGIQLGNVVLLGSNRPVNDAERAKVQEYAPEAVTEFDLMCGAAVKVFGQERFEEDRPKEVGYDHTGEARLRVYEVPGGPAVTVFDAPAPVGKPRPNTVDTYTFMREYFGSELADADVLVSTNAFYKPFQNVDALGSLSLPLGAQIETIGYDAAYGGVKRTPGQLLQETKSYIDSMARLDAALRQVSPERRA